MGLGKTPPSVDGVCTICDVEKTRKGLALLIGGVVVCLLGALLGTRVGADFSQITSALTLAGAIAVVVGLIWVVTGLWQGDKAKSDR